MSSLGSESGFGGLTVDGLLAGIVSGELSVADLTRAALTRIESVDRSGPCLRAVLEVNPTAEDDAAALDSELRTSGPRGPLHGLPVLIKDNIDTAGDMLTTAGSLALTESHPRADATVVARLRAAGAVILGKANLSEWANFRSTRSSSGWSARGGQTLNPHVLDRTPCGSSSGSAAAVAAGMAPVALGTETDGSIVCPASICGVVGIKPTVGLTSRAGVIPIAASQDTVGIHARTVADAAAVLGVIAGPDPRDPATAGAPLPPGRDYTRFLDPDALHGARIGVARNCYFGYSEHTDRVVEAAVEAMRRAGAVIVDPADIPTAQALGETAAELTVLCYEFHAGLDAYLAERGDLRVRSLADLVAFNQAEAEREMPFFRQEHLISALATGPLTEPEYLAARAECVRLGRTEGIDAVLATHRLDAVVAPTGAPAWTIDLVNGDRILGSSCEAAALAGYPLITVPAGDALGHLPIGVTFMGGPFSEPRLISLAHAFERLTMAGRAPAFLPTLPLPS